MSAPVKPRVNHESDIEIEKEAARLLSLHFTDLTCEFIHVVANLYFLFFSLRRRGVVSPIFSGFNRDALNKAASTLAYLAGYEENHPPFIVKYEVGWVSLHWKDGDPPQQ